MVSVILGYLTLACCVGSEVSVDEKRIELRLDERTGVVLEVENEAHQELSVDVTLELLDPRGEVYATGSSIARTRPGTNTISVTMSPSLGELDPAESAQLILYRLRYRVEPSSRAALLDVAPAEGIVSLSEIARELFELRIVYSELVQSGRALKAAVIATHPTSSLPIRGVALNGSITMDETQIASDSGVTDRQGLAVLNLDLPARLPNDDRATLSLTAFKGTSVVELMEDVNVYRGEPLLVSTDKRLYQPGQTLHLRFLAFDGRKRAIPDAAATLRVTDPDQELVFAADLTTSRFGIASADWEIPEDVRLGNYDIVVALEEDVWGDMARGNERVRVSRYDLPEFSVTAAPDRAFYLPGEKAAVDVSARYVFGEPVTSGTVRVVRAQETHWDYRAQKWEIEEGEEILGRFDEGGGFTAEIDLAEAHEDLEYDEYGQSHDLELYAFVTDDSTGRTEQRRFRIRVSRHPLHVYAIDVSTNRPGEPTDFYVSTFSADGSPVESDVVIRYAGDGNRLAEVRTNRYGVARVERVTLPETGSYYDREILLEARDAQGREGRASERYWSYYRDRIDVRMDETLHRPGDPIRASVEVGEDHDVVLVQVMREREVLHSRVVKLRRGRAEVTVPYEPAFTGALAVVATPFDEAVRWGDVGQHPVVYPADLELTVTARAGEPRYEPGGEASLRFDVKKPGGAGTESALGVVVVDEALLERQRTDEEFGGRGGFYSFYDWLGWDESLGGITQRDILRLDPGSEIDEDIDLVAEILFRYNGYSPSVLVTERHWTNVREVFAPALARDLAPLQSALDDLYQEGRYPETLEQVTTDLTTRGIDLSEIRDPWGNPFFAEIRPSGAHVSLTLSTSGPDERPWTADDFTGFETSWKYFEKPGRSFDRAVERYHDRTGRYIRDESVLWRELRDEGVDLEALRDPWGRPYHLVFDVDGSYYTIDVYSDRTRVWRSRIDYFAAYRDRIVDLLERKLRESGTWPDSEADMEALFAREGLPLSDLRDPWGRRYYLKLGKRAVYTDRVVVEAKRGERREAITPVTRRLAVFRVVSLGPDPWDKKDEIVVGEWERLVEEQETLRFEPRTGPEMLLRAGIGEIWGVVTDESGGVLPGVTVHLEAAENAGPQSRVTSASGEYRFQELRPGEYTVRAELAGFTTLRVEGIVVKERERVEVDLTLHVATMAETVTVTGQSPLIQTANASVASATVERIRGVGGTRRIATPRLRQFFPETLLWVPELVTDARGSQELTFPLADNITTWNVAVVASTEDGFIGAAETEVLAFRPFFLVHEPPKVLTEGDHISLPVVVRNFLDDPVDVDVTLEPAAWYEAAASKRSETVAAGGSARASFPMDVLAPERNAALRAVALSSESSDAVEKPLDIRPDGEEIVTTATLLLDRSSTWRLDYPDEALEGSMNATLKIYPNLMAHVLESVDGILRRPYGCAEQQISSAYPAVLLLKYQAAHDVALPSLGEARRNIRLAYQRLEDYQHPDGGFSYWGRGHPSVALTAYAVRFLEDAEPFLEVDPERIAKAKRWLTAQQQAEGQWTEVLWAGAVSEARTLMTTASVASAIASSEPAEARRAIDYLAKRLDGLEEPYLLANVSLTARALGDTARADAIAERLRALARNEGALSYWHLQTNTPFYGWGRAGRIETTALAVRALAQATPGAPDALVERGLLFLLRNKDRYGAWFTTQATIRSVEALLEVLPHRAPPGEAGARAVDVLVNGSSATTASLPEPGAVTGPIYVELEPFLEERENAITIEGEHLSAAASLVSTYYRPWDRAAGADVGEPTNADVRLSVRYPSSALDVGESSEIHVEVERVGYRGYGMMLAEIGLPPGADVDRLSLEALTADWGRGINRYEVRPESVVFYLWPRAGGQEFSFRFTPRFEMKAKTQPSVLYDYYNPEARFVVAPVLLEAR